MEKWSSKSQRRRHGNAYYSNFNIKSISPELDDNNELKSKWLQKFKPKSFLSFFKNSLKFFGYSLCTIACIYQVTGFIQLYLEYPSTMDIHVEFLNEVMLPAVSVCNKNWYKRDKFCEKYECPDPEKEVFVSTETQNTMTIDTIYEIGYQYEDLITNCNVTGAPHEEELTKAVCGNAIKYIESLRSCYILNSQWNGLTEYSPNTTNSFKLILKLDSQPKTYLQPKANFPPEIFLRVQNPYVVALNQGNEYIRIRSEMSYSITMTKSTINLLEPPFKPGCIDYRGNWKEAGGKGPLSREDCIDQCRINISMKNCGCVASYMKITANLKKCMQKAQTQCVNVGNIEYKNCDIKCLSDCEMQILDLSVTKDFRSINQLNQDKDNLSRSLISSESDVQIYMQTRRHMIYQHKPKITPVEILGYVGGYLSLWLGLSIPMVYDFFEISLIFTMQRMKSKPECVTKSPN